MRGHIHRLLAVTCTVVLAAFGAASLPPASAPPVTTSTARTSGQDVCHVGGQVYCALNPAVTDANVRQTICTPRWTKGLRPPASLTGVWKREILAALECKRLQGFPDGWTEGESDSARYRMLGNALAVPVGKWVGQRVLESLR